MDSKLIENIRVKNRTVSVDVDMDEDHQFAAAIEGDIMEKLDSCWDVDEIKIQFKS